ncbi:MAG: hypothetical protein C4329_09925 [Chitinophagaceae bacterium]
MNKILPLFLFIFVFTGCKKAIQQAQENAIIQAMTTGTWVVTQFKQNSNDITSSFSGYSFKYNTDRTVNAIKNSAVETTGSWDANSDALTIYANFLNANQPLPLLNGTWHIDNTTWTSVDASMTVGSELRTLKLVKQ